jgi:Holliday junction DNA helicase RuvA
MIASLSGVVDEKLDDQVVVDVKGVGYGVFVANEDYGRLAADQPAKLYIYEHVREQAHDLYGFINRETLNMFEMLLSVNGIGPKMALNMLSIGTTANLQQAISDGDVPFLQRASGVGKRVAERVVVDLKEKVGLGSSLNVNSLRNKDEAVEALEALGYTTSDAHQALKGIDPSLPTEERVKAALKAVA